MEPVERSSAEASRTEPAAKITLAGRGLHSGEPCRVTLSRTSGPVVLRQGSAEARVEELVVRRADHGVEVVLHPSGPGVDSVEHLLAALAGLSIVRGVAIEVEGGELPLLDGGALAFCRALEGVGARTEVRPLVVRCSGDVTVGTSTYSFSPGRHTEVRVQIAFDAPGVGVQDAAWDGSAASFVRDVAWARTFGFRRDEAALAAAGRARGVDPRTVMVLDAEGRVEPPGLPARPNEHALHKLLDLVGDAYLVGGPPRGRILATRPGHAATHRALRAALERGILGY